MKNLSDYLKILNLIVLITEAGQIQDERMSKIEDEILITNNKLKILIRRLK